MKTPSRYMPKYTPPKPTLAGWFLLVPVFVGAVAYAGFVVYKFPYVLLLLPLLLLFSRYEERAHKRRLSALAQKRTGSDIGTFARQFDYRRTDTRVIRAVYEQFQNYLDNTVPGFPLYADDEIYRDLLVDEDDFELDIMEEIAQRTGRSSAISDMEQNSYYKKMQREGAVTLRDIVLFFNAQPMTG